MYLPRNKCRYILKKTYKQFVVCYKYVTWYFRPIADFLLVHELDGLRPQLMSFFVYHYLVQTQKIIVNQIYKLHQFQLLHVTEQWRLAYYVLSDCVFKHVPGRCTSIVGMFVILPCFWHLMSIFKWLYDRMIIFYLHTYV